MQGKSHYGWRCHACQRMPNGLDCGLEKRDCSGMWRNLCSTTHLARSPTRSAVAVECGVTTFVPPVCINSQLFLMRLFKTMPLPVPFPSSVVHSNLRRSQHIQGQSRKACCASCSYRSLTVAHLLSVACHAASLHV